MCAINCLFIAQKYSVEINYQSFQLNHSLNIFLTDNFSNILVFCVMVFHQIIKEVYVI